MTAGCPHLRPLLTDVRRQGTGQVVPRQRLIPPSMAMLGGHEPSRLSDQMYS